MTNNIDAGPYDLSATGATIRGNAVALCIHGLTGTPYEVRPLAEALAASGVRAIGPVLPGHNSSPEELMHVKWPEWYAKVESEYRALRSQYTSVFIVGLSLGALMGLALAAEETVEGVVAVATPLAFRQPIPFLVPFMKHLRPMLPKKGGSDIRDPAARAIHPGYGFMPLAAVEQLVLAQRSVRARLSQITAPALIAHGRHDITANPADSIRIVETISSVDKQHLVLPDSAHIVPVDHDGAALGRAVCEFVLARIRDDVGELG